MIRVIITCPAGSREPGAGYRNANLCGSPHLDLDLDHDLDLDDLVSDTFSAAPLRMREVVTDFFGAAFFD